MLKHLYMTFVIAILSGSLVMLQTNAAFAGVTVSGGTNTTDSTGKITNTKQYHFDEIRDADMLSSLAMLSGGFIASRMAATYSPMTTDVMIAAAGGVAFIAGEVMTNMKFQGTIKEMTIEVQKKSGEKVNEEQIQRLEDLKKSYQEAKKTTGKKKTLQMGAAVAFAAAAAMAGYLNYQEYAAVGKCQATIAQQSANCTPGSTTTYSTAIKELNIVRQNPGETGVRKQQAEMKEGTLKTGVTCTPIPGADPATTAANVTRAASAKAAIDTTCNAALLKLSSNQIFKYKFEKIGPATSEYNLMKNFLGSKIAKFESSIKPEKTNFFDRVLGLFISKAQASWLPLLGLSAGVAVAFFAITGATAISIDLFMFAPFNRMLIFGGLGGISLLAAKSSANTMKKLDANIAAIDKILLDLNKMAKGVKAQNITHEAYEMRTVDPLAQRELPTVANNKTKTPCMTGNNTTNCSSLNDQLKNMPGFANLPDSFKDIASLSTSMGDNLSGATEISGSALANAEALGGKQNAVARVLKARQDAIEKLTNSPGSIKKAEDKFMDGWKKNIQKTLQSKGMTAAGMMASIGTTPIDSKVAGVEKIDDVKKTTPVAAAAINIAPKGDGKDKGLELDFKEAPVDNFVAAGSGSSGSSPEYEIPTNEINEDSGPSIFEVISIRYLKSGYPKLLEEEPAKKE